MKSISRSASRGEKVALQFGQMYPLLSSSYQNPTISNGKQQTEDVTYMTKRRVYDPTHLGDAPFDHIAEVLVVYVVVLSSD